MEQRHLPQDEAQPSTEMPIAVPDEQYREATEVSDELLSQQVLPDRVEEVSAALTRETKEFRRDSVRAALVVAVLFGIVIWICMKLTENSTSFLTFLLSTLGLALLYVMQKFPADLRIRRQRRDMTKRLMGQSRLQTVGALIDALQLDDMKTREIAQDGLIELLPRLKASDSHLLTEAHHAKLRNILSMPVENPLFKEVRYLFQPAQDRAVSIRVAILKAFEQVGDSRELPLVSRLAEREAKTKGEKAIQAAAEDCLPALKMRTEQQQSSQTLLRASAANATLPEVLLRPAHSNQDIPPEQLLRASEPG